VSSVNTRVGCDCVYKVTVVFYKAELSCTWSHSRYLLTGPSDAVCVLMCVPLNVRFIQQVWFVW